MTDAERKNLLSAGRWLLVAALLGLVSSLIFGELYLHAVDMPQPQCLRPPMIEAASFVHFHRVWFV